MSFFGDVASTRKQYPLYSGLFKYFPRALAAVSHLSYVGNEQHNPGEPLHWARGKSTDHLDCLLRHMIDDIIDPVDSDGVEHLVKVAWRALAELETQLEKRTDGYNRKKAQ